MKWYEVLLQVLGVSGAPTKDETNVVISCPYHADLRPSLWIRDDGVWHCFSCERKGRLPVLLADMLGMSVDEAQRKAYELAREGEWKLAPLDLPVGIEYYDWEQVQKTMGYGVTEELLGYLANRGIDDVAAEEFRFRDDGRGHVVIPTFLDESYQRTAFVQRRTMSGKAYFNELGSSKSSYVFGIPQMRSTENVWLVENAFAVAYLWQYDVTALALFGSQLSARQVQLIEAVCDSVILAFDVDDAGVGALYQADRMLKLPMGRVVYPDGVYQPDELSPEEIRGVVINWRLI